MNVTPEEKRRERMEADLLAEDFSGKPVNYGSTEKAIAELQERLTYLRKQLDGVIEYVEMANQIRADILSAEAQLAAYELQLKNKN